MFGQNQANLRMARNQKFQIQTLTIFQLKNEEKKQAHNLQIIKILDGLTCLNIIL